MADRSPAGATDKAICRWVRERLPLFVGDEDQDDQADLGAEERLQIEQHLGSCTACRDRRAALGDVMSILGQAAAEAPATATVAAAADSPAEAGSILPGVDAQIRWHRDPSRTAWDRARRALRLPGAATPPHEAYARLRAERPLQLAWIRDSLREAAAQLERDVPALPAPRLDLRLAAAVVLLAFGACLLAGTAHHRRAEAEARIAANAGAIPGLEASRREAMPTTAPGLFEPEPDPIAVVADDDEAAGPAHPDRTTPVETVAIALAPTPTPTSAPTPAPASRPAASLSPATRYDFALEHGIPMPPETRVGKPAY